MTAGQLRLSAELTALEQPTTIDDDLSAGEVTVLPSRQKQAGD